MNMNMSQRGLELLTEWEGFRTHAYVCSGGKMTIGVGHVLTAQELRTGNLMFDKIAVPWRKGLTMKHVRQLLALDLPIYERAVNKVITVPLEQHQFDALVSFCFNVGVGAFCKSTLVDVLNAGSYEGVVSELKKWIKAGGRVVQGLINRRNNEIKLWRGAL